MAGSTYKCKLRKDVMPVIRMHFPVNTSSQPIESGDLLELGDSTGTVQILQDDQVTASHKFIGVSDGKWNSSLNDSTLEASIGIAVILVGVFQATLASGTYVFGDALEYSASQDDGSLKAYTALQTNQLIGWIFDAVTGTRTTGRVYIDIRDYQVGTFEVTS